MDTPSRRSEPSPPLSGARSDAGADGDLALASLLSAAGDPIRLKLLKLLREPRSVGALCGALEMAQPRVSHHLAVLREQGLVQSTPRGRQRVYSWSTPVPGSPVEGLQRYLLRHGDLPSPRAAPATGPAPRAAGPSPAHATTMEDFLL